MPRLSAVRAGGQWVVDADAPKTERGRSVPDREVDTVEIYPACSGPGISLPHPSPYLSNCRAALEVVPRHVRLRIDTRHHAFARWDDAQR